jgi:hypothetical protein
LLVSDLLAEGVATMIGDGRVNTVMGGADAALGLAT